MDGESEHSKRLRKAEENYQRIARDEKYREAFGGKTVYVLDDHHVHSIDSATGRSATHHDTADSLATLLNMYGAKTRAFYTEAELNAALENGKGRPDLIISDHQKLPVAEAEGIPVVHYTGWQHLFQGNPDAAPKPSLNQLLDIAGQKLATATQVE